MPPRRDGVGVVAPPLLLPILLERRRSDLPPVIPGPPPQRVLLPFTPPLLLRLPHQEPVLLKPRLDRAPVAFVLAGRRLRFHYLLSFVVVRLLSRLVRHLWCLPRAMYQPRGDVVLLPSLVRGQASQFRLRFWVLMPLIAAFLVENPPLVPYP